MYIPDLFGAYIKGRELAIEKNWLDLKNYEQVESMRNANDLQALQLLAERADFGGKRSMFQNQVDNSARANEVAEYAQPGMVARADMGSMFAQDQRGVYLNNRPLAQQTMNSSFRENLRRLGNASTAMQGQNDYLSTDGRAYQMGQNSGNVAFQQSQANNVTANNYVNAATQQVTQSNLNHRNNVAGSNLAYGQTQNAIELLPAQQTLAKTTIGNAQHTADNFIGDQADVKKIEQANRVEQAHREYISYMQAAAAGDQHAAAAAQRIAQQYGFGEQTPQGQTPQGQTPQGQAMQGVATNQALIPTPAQQAVAQAGMQSSVVQQLLPNIGQPIYPYPVAPGTGLYRPAVPAPIKPDVWANYQNSVNYTGP